MPVMAQPQDYNRNAFNQCPPPIPGDTLVMEPGTPAAAAKQRNMAKTSIDIYPTGSRIAI
jgi:hypothetical protein